MNSMKARKWTGSLSASVPSMSKIKALSISNPFGSRIRSAKRIGLASRSHGRKSVTLAEPDGVPPSLADARKSVAQALPVAKPARRAGCRRIGLDGLNGAAGFEPGDLADDLRLDRLRELL